jgi:GTPase SAR1 family protein
LTENKITDVDIVHGPPSEIKTLCLSKNRIVNTLKMRSTSLPCASPLFLLSTQPERASCFTYCTHCQRTHLNHLAKLTLDHNLLTKFDLIDVSKDTHEEELSQNLQAFTSIDIELLFPNITVLNLSHNQLKYVPRNIEKLTSLSSLYLSGNTAITELPEELGVMNPQVFLTLFLDGVFIKNIPQSILNTSTRNIICYFKSIREKSQTYRRIKLMVVGEDNKGKTSLLLNLTRQGSMVRFREVALDHRHQPLATNGVELGDWEYAPRGRQKVTFMTWDFGGQEEYYATHQCFLTNRSLFLLVWNVMDGEAGLLSLRPWLENIEARAKDSPVIVVATHADGLPHSSYKDCVAQLQSRLKELYSHGEDSFAYPKNCTPMHVVNCRDNEKH